MVFLFKMVTLKLFKELVLVVVNSAAWNLSRGRETLKLPFAFGQEIVSEFFFKFVFGHEDRKTCTLKILYGCLIFAW